MGQGIVPQVVSQDQAGFEHIVQQHAIDGAKLFQTRFVITAVSQVVDPDFEQLIFGQAVALQLMVLYIDQAVFCFHQIDHMQSIPQIAQNRRGFGGGDVDRHGLLGIQCLDASGCGGQVWRRDPGVHGNG